MKVTKKTRVQKPRASVDAKSTKPKAQKKARSSQPTKRASAATQKASRQSSSVVGHAIRHMLEAAKPLLKLASGSTGPALPANAVKKSHRSNAGADIKPQQIVDIGRKAGHKISLAKAKEVAPHLNSAMHEAKIDTPRKKAAFIAQLAHESAGFKHSEELASGRAYEGRRNLGNVQKGDGVRFKGRGYIQLTGRANYNAASTALGLDLVNHPELAAKPQNAARVAAWFWTKNNLNKPAEAGNFDQVTRTINGGLNGKADRDKLYQAATKVLAGSRGLPTMGQEATFNKYAPLIDGSLGEGVAQMQGIKHNVRIADDHYAVLWRDNAGQAHVEEYEISKADERIS